MQLFVNQLFVCKNANNAIVTLTLNKVDPSTAIDESDFPILKLKNMVFKGIKIFKSPPNHGETLNHDAKEKEREKRVAKTVANRKSAPNYGVITVK